MSKSIHAPPALRHSRMPSATAVIGTSIVSEEFRRLGTLPPGPADNDVPSEEELFAIWTARLL